MTCFSYYSSPSELDYSWHAHVVFFMLAGGPLCDGHPLLRCYACLSCSAIARQHTTSGRSRARAGHQGKQRWVSGDILSVIMKHDYIVQSLIRMHKLNECELLINLELNVDDYMGMVLSKSPRI